MKKKAVLISCFHYYERRMRLVDEYFAAQGYENIYITADFDHVGKQPFKAEIANCVQIPTRPYAKNLSAARLLSHLMFSCDTFREIEEIAPDVIYMVVPPNSLCSCAAKYKKKHPQVKLIYDLYDLWPETFPSSKMKKMLKVPFALWQYARDGGLHAADIILTECELYQQRLQKQLSGKQTGVLPLCAPWDAPVQAAQCYRAGEINLCYLGSINSIIDIPCIAALVQELGKRCKVTLHIIGGGETHGQLLAAAQAAGAQVIDHGLLYDRSALQRIYDQCDFGLNMMKDSVCVGLTMKSVDYVAGGLPVINTIPADTQKWLHEYNAGVQVERENLTATAQKILSLTAQEHAALRRGAAKLHREKLSKAAFMNALNWHIGDLVAVNKEEKT